MKNHLQSLILDCWKATNNFFVNIRNGEPYEVQKNCLTLVGFETTATELRNQTGDSRYNVHHIVHIAEQCETKLIEVALSPLTIWTS